MGLFDLHEEQTYVLENIYHKVDNYLNNNHTISSNTIKKNFDSKYKKKRKVKNRIVKQSKRRKK